MDNIGFGCILAVRAANHPQYTTQTRHMLRERGRGRGRTYCHTKRKSLKSM